MRIFALAAILAMTTPAIASAQLAPTPASPAAAGSHYSTSATEIGVLLDDPAARVVLDKHLPGMTTNEQVEMARAMTLKDIQQYNPDAIADKVLAAIDEDLIKIPVKK